jgi:N-acetylglucosaminyldiphosphoundecaprenol N-acetyl-beta-D-mannosaminyltransferase
MEILEKTMPVKECPPKRAVLGVGISTTSYAEVARYCKQWIEARHNWTEKTPGLPPSPAGRYICVTSVHGTVTATMDPLFRAILNDADIATPDGMPVVWALRSFQVTGQQRVYGPELMLVICEQAAQLGHRLFLYGGREAALQDLRRRLLERFPRLTIAGTYSPPFRALTPEEDAAVSETITRSNADIIFVGLSTPKQEKWMSQHRDRFPGVVLVGVGAAFDFHAGRVRQAPPWMQRAGLEWLFRLLMEPRRLWKRYLLVTPLFLPLWAMQKVGILKYRDVP